MSQDTIMGGVNGMMQFLGGYLEAEGQKKEQQKKDQHRKKMEDQLNTGNFTVEYDQEGNIKLKQLSPADLALASQRQAQTKMIEAQTQGLGTPQTQPVVDPATGKTLYDRPKGAVFAPSGGKKNYLFKLPPKEREKSWFGFGGYDYNEDTFNVMQGLKTEEDLEYILENRQAYEKRGVDIQKILDFYNQ